MRDFLSRVKRPCHLAVRISGSHPENMGSIPIRATQTDLDHQKNLFQILLYNFSMILPWYIVSKGSLLETLSLLGKGTANSIGPLIFMPQAIYKDLKSQNPNLRHIALLIHEETHRKRQKAMGFIKFGFQYLFNSKFRFEEELIAVKEAMKYLKKNKIQFEFDKNAKFLSSFVYLWPVSKNYAKKELRKIWNEL